jgi:hypothetical protein
MLALEYRNNPGETATVETDDEEYGVEPPANVVGFPADAIQRLLSVNEAMVDWIQSFTRGSEVPDIGCNLRRICLERKVSGIDHVQFNVLQILAVRLRARG